MSKQAKEMEQNLPIVAKKFWNIVRVLYLVLRKEISKGKLLFDLNMALHRSKLADKLAQIRNLMFHHIYHNTNSSVSHHHHFPEPVKECKVRIKNGLKKRKSHHGPPPADKDDFMASPLETFHSALTSPAVFGATLAPVRQVRITDSPFLVTGQEETNKGVDEDAEEFINKFYQKLRRQYGVANNC